MAVVADLASVQAWMGSNDAALTAALTTILNGVDQAFEQYMMRPLLTQQRTDYPKTRRFQRLVTLSAAPTVSVASVIVDEDRVFTGVAPLDASAYAVRADPGQIWFDDELPDGVNVVQIVHTSGMASDVASFIQKWPSLHEAALYQIQFEYQRRKTAGAVTEVSQGATKTFHGQVQLLDMVKQRLDPFRRIRF